MTQKKSLIVVGAGMTGLSAALTWALNNDCRGKPVLLLDKNPVTGGLVNTYKRRGYLFDTNQMISNLSPVFEYFGLDIKMAEFKGNFARIFKADTNTGKVKIINLPSGFEAFKSHLRSEYPDESGNIEKFLDYSQIMYREIKGLKYAPNPLEMIRMLFTCPRIIKNVSKNFEEYIGQFGIRNKEVFDILRLFSVFCGLPENRVAALLPVGVMLSLLEKAYRPESGFIILPQKMEKRYIELGGELRLNTEVEHIIIEKGMARGVRLKNGENILAENVISTIDVQKAMKELVGMETIRKRSINYAGKVESLTMTPSVFTINLGLDDNIDLTGKGFDCGYNMLTSGSAAFNKLYSAFEKNETAFSEDCFHLGIICPFLTTGGKPYITITGQPFTMGNWNIWRKDDPVHYRKEKEKWGDLFIHLTERYVIPGLSSHIVVKDISTPATYSRYSGSPTGSQYDMASFPDNFGIKRLNMKTPIHGLYQPKFAQGVYGTIHGGMQAVDLIMKRSVMNGNSRF